MPVESVQTIFRSRGAAGGVAMRTAVLVAGVSLDRLLRRSLRCMTRPMLVGIGLSAASTAIALIHLGVDVGAGFAGGQSGLLPTLVQTATAGEAQPASLPSECDGVA
jgi:hypothetical protein